MQKSRMLLVLALDAIAEIGWWLCLLRVMYLSEPRRDKAADDAGNFWHLFASSGVIVYHCVLLYSGKLLSLIFRYYRRISCNYILFTLIHTGFYRSIFPDLYILAVVSVYKNLIKGRIVFSFHCLRYMQGTQYSLSVYIHLLRMCVKKRCASMNRQPMTCVARTAEKYSLFEVLFVIFRAAKTIGLYLYNDSLHYR